MRPKSYKRLDTCNFCKYLKWIPDKEVDTCSFHNFTFDEYVDESNDHSCDDFLFWAKKSQVKIMNVPKPNNTQKTLFGDD